MAARHVTRRASRSVSRKQNPAHAEAYRRVALSLIKLRRAADLLRSTYPMTFDGGPSESLDAEYAALARTALECIEEGESHLGEIPVAVKEWRAAGHVERDLFHAFDALSCAIYALDNEYHPDAGSGARMTESAPGGAFQCVWLVLRDCIARLSDVQGRLAKRVRS